MKYDPFKYFPIDMFIYRHKKELTRAEQESGKDKYNNMIDDTRIRNSIQRQK